MNREAFEKIQRVKDHLEQFDIYYTSLGGYLYTKDTTPCFYLNGAWMMYQSQQKRLQSIYDDCTEYTTVSELLNSIHRLLQ